MTGPDHEHHPATDEIARLETPLERELAAVEPVRPSAHLRERIAAALGVNPARLTWTAARRNTRANVRMDVPTRSRGWPVRGVSERLAWAVGGALAATMVIGLATRGGPPPSTGPATRARGDESPAVPVRSEESIAWADEGVRFLDHTTPARVLRRYVVERHRGADGLTEVRVPREDLIILPVALR